MKAKAKGYRNEAKARRFLQEQGYMVIRSGGSFGPFDIVAIGPRWCRLIQVRSNRSLGPLERQRLEEFPDYPYTIREVWVYRDGSRYNNPLIEVV